jgi:hypothetical protein
MCRRWVLSLLLLFALCPLPDSAQKTDPQPAHLSDTQKDAIRRTLLARMDKDAWCTKGKDDAFVKDLAFSAVPVADHQVILVSPGAGCATGAQGSNSALWLFDLNADSPRLIGSPALKLGGWWENVLPHVSHGYHDFNVGWHLGGAEFTLTTFRFDGQTYRPIHSETVSPGSR